jgi:hypothetical protein
MRRLPWIVLVAVGFAFAACGGDDDASPFGGDDDEPTTAPTSASSDDGGDDSGDSGNGGGDANAFVTAGDESFEFTVTCQFGTGIIQGPGSAADGTPSFLVASMPVTERGQPLNDPLQVDLRVAVGKETMIGPSLYEYGDPTDNAPGYSYSDDGNHAEGTIQLEYRTSDGAKEGLAYGDLVDGTFNVTCP